MKLKPLSPASDEVRIEIVPLMDVIFCILTFFILGAVGLTRQQAIEQNLPQASTGEQQMREMFRVSIDPIGRIYVDRDPVSFDELPDRLRAYQESNPEGLVVLFGHPMAQYDDVLQVLDLLRSIGGDRVSLGINPSSESPQERNQRQNPFNRVPTAPQRAPFPTAPLPGTPDTSGDATDDPSDTPAFPGLDGTAPNLEPNSESGASEMEEPDLSDFTTPSDVESTPDTAPESAPDEN